MHMPRPGPKSLAYTIGAMSLPTSSKGNTGPSTLVRRVRLTNYRSVAACDVSLGALTFLVGPNGSGKSNFLDSLRFLSDTFKYGIDHAIQMRGLADDIITRNAVAEGVNEFSIQLDLALPGESEAHFAFTLRVRSLGGSDVRHEKCTVTAQDPALSARYEVADGKLLRWDSPSLRQVSLAPPRSQNYFYLFNLSGFPEFLNVSQAISNMMFYSLNTSIMRGPRLLESSNQLHSDGSNIASMLRQMTERSPDLKRRVDEYLSAIVPGLRRVDSVKVGRHIALEFHQAARSDAPVWRFQSEQMSEGTLRALGVLIALFQARLSTVPSLSLVGIEEPEHALHPAAVGALLDALMDASETTQVMVTSHSSDLLDRVDPEEVTLLAVSSENGASKIGPVDRVGRTVLRERLYTPGELLRMNQLSPEEDRSDGAAHPPLAVPE